MRRGKKIIVSVSNDLNTDQRLDKVCSSLSEAGFQVTLIGRKLPKSKKLEPRQYKTKRFPLWFKRGPLFYANLNLRLLIYLIFHKKDILLSNDLDTLPANFIASKLSSVELIYDSHEYFTEVPELIDRPKQKAIWEKLESFFLPKVKKAYTVSQLIAEAYEKKYGIKMELIRNFPKKENLNRETKKENYLIYQGALNIGRGLPELIQAMPFVEEVQLYLAGAGDIEQELRSLVKELNLESRVKFLGRIEPSDLRAITVKAKLGFSIEKDMGLNYRFAVPNKIFDYIQANVPVLYSPLPEVLELLADYQVGEVLKSHEPKELAKQIKSMLDSNEYTNWESECMRAAQVFTWENEEEKLLKIMKS